MDGGQGAAVGPGGSGEPLSLELLDQAVAMLEKLTAAVDDAAWLSDPQSLELVRGLSRLQALVGAGYLAAVRDLDSRAEAVEGAREGRVAHTFLSIGLRLGPRQAAADVRRESAGHHRPAAARPGADRHGRRDGRRGGPGDGRRAGGRPGRGR